VTISDGITTIAGYAFNGVKISEGVKFGNTVTSIGGYAFQNCGLTSLILPESLKTIGASAFAVNSIAPSIVIPGNVTSVDVTAFNSNPGITSIEVMMNLKASDGVYDPETGKYLQAPAAVQGRAPFSAVNAASNVYYQDSDKPIFASTPVVVPNPDKSNSVQIAVSIIVSDRMSPIVGIAGTPALKSTTPSAGANLPWTAVMIVPASSGNGTYYFDVTFSPIGGGPDKQLALPVSVTLFHDLTFDANLEGVANPNAGNPYVQGYKITPLKSQSDVYAMNSTPGKPDGVTFKGWSLTKKDVITAASQLPAFATDYTMGTSDGTLYAVWAADANENDVPDYEEKYSLTYDLGTGTAGTGPVPNPATDIPIQKNYVLSTSAPTHAADGTKKIVFAGWTLTSGDASTVYAAEDTVPASITKKVDIWTGNVTVYAVWGYDLNDNEIPDVTETYTLTYDINGGTAGTGPVPDKVEDLKIQEGYALDTTIPEHADAPGTTDSIIFIGWSLQKDTTIFKGGDPEPAILDPAKVDIYDGNVTVYAVWGYDLNDNDTPDVYDGPYTLTYDLNGGNYGGDTSPVDVTPLYVQRNYVLNDTGPEHDDDATGTILFIGWTETPDTYIYLREDDAPVTITKTDIMDNVTVYAVWGYDLNNNTIPDVLEPNIPEPPVSKIYYIKPSADANSTISPDKTVTVSRGGSATFTFSAKDGYHITSVTIDSVPLTQAQIDSGSYTFRDVAANHTISVKSSVGGDQRTDLTLTINVKEGKGYAEYRIGNSGSFTKYTGTVTIASGTNVTVRAISDDGYSFGKWMNGNTTYTASERTFNSVSSSLTLDLYFDESNDNGGWAVLNIVCAILALIIGIVAIIAGIGRRKDNEKRSKTAMILRIIAFILGIVSVIVFLATEDLSLSSIMTDSWSIPMVILMVVTLIFAIVSFRLDKVKDQT
jgi:hypothetical protein